MEKPLKERLLGALVLVSLATIFIPMLFDEPKSGEVTLANNQLPTEPGWAESAVEFTVPESLRTVPSTSNALVTHAQQPASVAEKVEALEQVAEVSEEKIMPMPEEAFVETSETQAPVLQQAPTQVANTAQVPKQVVNTAQVPKQVANIVQAPKQVENTVQVVPVEPKKRAVSSAAEIAAEIPTLEKPDAYAVQLATFSNKENAKVLMERLRAKGYDAYVREAFGGGHRIRVLVGPRIERKQAEQLRDKLSAEFALNGFIIPYQPIEG
jgi:DedD protein